MDADDTSAISAMDTRSSIDEADAWDNAQPSISVSVTQDTSPEQMESSEAMEREASPLSSCFSYSPGSATSTPTTPSSSRLERSVSASTLVSDRELISRVWSSSRDPREVQTLDLGSAIKQTRRALKSLGALSEFENLTVLDASNNAVADLSGLEALPRLETLVLSRNHLKRIGPELFSLTCLRDVDLSGNFIAHIPRSIAKLVLLERLNLSGNSLSTLKEVDALSSLSNLHMCSLSANPFCKLPTYRDYVVFKLAGLETLDGLPITAAGRDKSRRRFFDVALAKDAQLREAGEAHENEQSRLREVQSALEAENLRLKGELQVKSQLLTNKSRAWSDATERLIQLQQEITMLNLERQQQQHAVSTKILDEGGMDCESDGGQHDFAREEVSAAPPALGGSSGLAVQVRPLVSSPNPSDLHRSHGSRDLSPFHHRQHSSAALSQTPGLSPSRGEAIPSPNLSPPRIETRLQRSPVPLKTMTNRSETIVTSMVSTASPAVSTSTASRLEAKRWDASAAYWDFIAEEVAASERASSPLESPKATRAQRSENFERVRRAFSAVDPGGVSTSENMEEIHLEDEEKAADPFTRRRPSQFPTVEDEFACPAYEDSHAIASSSTLPTPTHWSQDQSKLRPGSRAASGVDSLSTQFHRTTSSPGRLLSSSHYSVKSPSQRIWEHQHRDFKEQVLSPRLKATNKAGYRVASSPASKDMLIRKTQALQSCKQVLLRDIAKEEELLHSLKIQEKQFTTQIEGVQINIQACIDAAKADEQASLKMPFSVPSGSHSPHTAGRQKDGVVLAKLEVLRSKLLLVEDREKEIEMSMVRKTKRVLEADATAVSASMGIPLSSITATDSAFDKEIFALTNKLQMTIVQKEELQLEIARVMTQLRDQHRRPSLSDGTRVENNDGINFVAGGASPVRSSHGSTNDERVQKDPSLAQSYQLMTELQQKHQDVADRVRVKEDLLASLVDELREVEAELEHIGRFGALPLSSQDTDASRVRRPRSASFDFLQESRVFHRPGKGKPLFKESSQTSSQIVAPVDPSQQASTEEIHSRSETADVAVEDSSSRIFTTSGGDPTPSPQSQHRDFLTVEMLEQVKNEVFAKLSEQFAVLSSSVGGTTEHSVQQEQRELHDAIAAALDAHMKLAMDTYEKKKQQTEGKAMDESSNDRTDMHDGEQQSHSPVSLQPGMHSGDDSHEEEDSCWDHFAELSPMEAIYSVKYKFAKHHESLARSSGPKNAAVIAGTQRILKACERLDIARTECRTSPTTFMEIDSAGNTKSTLKVLLMGARDLPTSHLRTKSLDPYVCLEIVYPDLKSKAGARGASAVPLVMQSFRSRTQKKTMYPVWDEEFDFCPVLSLNGYLHVRILNDRKASREQLVGETRIPLRTLLHQRRAIDWYSLGITMPSSTGFRSSSARRSSVSKVVSKMCGGAVRLQLQLSFSRVEKYKRLVDELVTKFLHEYNHLPPFIEAVDSNGEAVQEHPEQDESNPLLPSLGSAESGPKSFERENNWHPLSSTTEFPLSELEASLPTYGKWKTEVVEEFPVTPVPTSNDDECFDEYSPYHPAFQLVDLFDGGNNEFVSKNRRVSPACDSTALSASLSRKTDLRIFKSPGFSRRQPSSGFPERYIGLDNQTCERLKRMFGRIDATGADAVSRRPRPNR